MGAGYIKIPSPYICKILHIEGDGIDEDSVANV